LLTELTNQKKTVIQTMRIIYLLLHLNKNN
jgi:hypothetical protein